MEKSVRPADKVQRPILDAFIVELVGYSAQTCAKQPKMVVGCGSQEHEVMAQECFPKAILLGLSLGKKNGREIPQQVCEVQREGPMLFGCRIKKSFKPFVKQVLMDLKQGFLFE